MSKLDLLTELQSLLAKATADGILDELSAAYTSPEMVNEFCDAVSAMLANERERNQAR